MNKQLIYTQAIIVIASALLFIPYAGGVHLFDWDEINFAEAAREMLISGNYLSVQIDFRPFLEKPPLFIWMQALSMHIFGINEFAARFPNAIAGIVSLLVLYRIGRKHVNHNFGVLWVMVYLGSVLSHFYFRTGIIDPWFNLFMFLGTYYIMQYAEAVMQNVWHMVYSGAFIGLAVLTKGPVGLLIPALVFVVYVIWKKLNIRLKIWHFMVFIAVFVLVGGSWFFIQMATGNTQTMWDFIIYQIRLFSTQDAGHGGFPLYHFVVIFFALFPASILALPAFRLRFSDQNKDFHLWMLIMFWVVIILFSIVKTKIVHYSSLAYFPLSFMATLVVYQLAKRNKALYQFQKVLLWVVSSLYFVVLLVMQFAVANAQKIVESGIVKDNFANGNLQAQVHWSGFEFLIALLPLATVFLFSLKQQNLYQNSIKALGATTLFVVLAVYVYVARIEGYSQRAAIEFMKEKSAETDFINPIGYKSYAHLFYGNRKLLNQANESKEEYNSRLLVDSTLTKVYFVTKNIKLKRIQEENPNLEVIGEKNGFVFLKRK